MKKTLVVVAALLVALPARAQDRKAEQAARDALQSAQTDFATNKFGKAVTRLRRASRACTRCSTQVRAQLLRDLGALQIHSGDPEAAQEAWAEALRLEPNADLTPRYDTPEVRAAWDAAKADAALASTPQPSGDFAHTPPAEGAANTPLALYFEIDQQLAKVTVRYKSDAMREFRPLELTRIGKGWGGLVPCGDVARGVLRYYVVGVDSSGTPVATAGDAKHTYFVRIKAEATGELPSLPGQPPPKKCAEGAPPAETPKPPPEEKPPPTEEKEKEEQAKAAPPGAFVRLWIGFGASLDLTPLPSANDVCRSQGNPYYCTDPHGNDYPPDPTVTFANNRAGNVGGGLTTGDVRVFAALDYAFTANVLAGARLGYVANSYPGTSASKAGHGFSIPFHAEARVTYLFGDVPLARTGFAPLLLGALGVGRYDASTIVQVAQTGIAGDRPTLAWNTSGPFFFAIGGGARYALSPRVAFLALAKATAAIGGGGLFPAVSPEIGLQYGF